MIVYADPLWTWVDDPDFDDLGPADDRRRRFEPSPEDERWLLAARIDGLFAQTDDAWDRQKRNLAEFLGRQSTTLH